MKARGNRVRNYNDKEWKEMGEVIAMECVKVMFQTHDKARRALLKTGKKVIGETTANTWYLHV